VNRKQSKLALVYGLFALVSQVAFATPIQWSGNGHYYEVIVEPGISWPDAQDAAVAKGGHLATVTSLDELEFIFDLTIDTPGAWISYPEWAVGPWLGARDVGGGTWEWVTDEPYEEIHHPDYPDPDDLDLNCTHEVNGDYLIFWGCTPRPVCNGASGSYHSYVIEYDSLLYISSIEPSSGAPGILVTIRGQGFTGSFQQWVNFGPSEIWGRGIPSKHISWTDTEIVVEVPKPALPNPSGERVVEVTVQKRFPPQASNSVPFTYNMPHIDSITPSLATPRTEIVIRGQHFGVPNKHLPEGYGIKFGLSNAYYWKSWTDNEIVIKAPKDYGTGQTEANIIKAIVKVLLYGLPELPPPLRSVIEALIEELIDSGVGIMPGEGEVRVNVIITTPVGESNAEPFTFTVK
jgi:hypothetical protein